jgi:hypothetical protein
MGNRAPTTRRCGTGSASRREVTEHLAGAPTALREAPPEATRAAEVAVAQVVRVLGAQAAGLWAADLPGGGLRLLAQQGRPGSAVSGLGTIPPAPRGVAAPPPADGGASPGGPDRPRGAPSAPKRSWTSFLPDAELDADLGIAVTRRSGRHLQRHRAYPIFVDDRLAGVLVYTVAPQPSPAAGRRERATVSALTALCRVALEHAVR